MIKNIERTTTTPLSHSDWLSIRRGSIGGSDAGAIVGLSEYASPYSVWADKTGRIPPKEDNEAMRQGRDLEEYVARRWAEATGKKVRRENAILKNPAYPFAHANIDRWVIGENAGLECKTTSVLNLKKFKAGVFPEQYYAQCVHYMAVTGADRWYLSVVVLGKEFMHFCLERDQEEIDALMSAEKDFWHYVEANEPPPVDGLDATKETLNAMFGGGNPDEVKLFDREGLLLDLQDTKARIKELETHQKALENTLREDMGDHELATTPGWRVTWKPQTRTSADVDRVRKEHPELLKETTTRVLRVTKLKQD